ncbi:xylanase precursor [Mycena leptocephala]|nr:xylanase precursor [Mycena leptocephala]
MNILRCLLAFLATAGGTAVSALPKKGARSGTTSISGTNFGYYYTFSAEDGDAVTYTNLDDSNYIIQWNNNSGYFIGGKGWNPGSAQSPAAPDHNSSISIYGWTTDPAVEYRIVESLASDVHPALGLTLQGTVTSDSSLYNIYKTQRPVLEYPPKSRGDGFVTVANHFNAWAAVGMPLGELGYQIIATEGHSSSGSAEVYTTTKPAAAP